jgi:hypothetical protein
MGGSIPPAKGARRRRGSGRRVRIGRPDLRLTGQCGGRCGHRGGSGVGHRGCSGRRGRPGEATPPRVDRGWFAVVDCADDRCGFPGRDGPTPRGHRRATAGTGADAGIDNHRAGGEAFRRDTSGWDRGRDRRGQHPGAGAGVAAAADPVVGGGHDRRGHHRCGGLRARQAGRGLQLPGAAGVPASRRLRPADPWGECASIGGCPISVARIASPDDRSCCSTRPAGRAAAAASRCWMPRSAPRCCPRIT